MNRRVRMRVLMLLALAGLATCHGFSMAGPARRGSLEDALFDDSRPGRFPTVDPSRVDPKRRAAPSPFPPERLNRRSFWAHELGMAGMSEDVLPLLSVAEQMRDVQNRISRAECGAATQHAQRQILDSLDQVLRHLGQSCGAAGAGSRDKPTEKQQPSPASSCKKPGAGQKSGNKQAATPDDTGKAVIGTGKEPAGDSKRVDAGQMRTLLKQLWGELPPRRRQQMLQLPVEEFLPSYELLIEQYFRRLSEEKQQQPNRPNPQPRNP